MKNVKASLVVNELNLWGNNFPFYKKNKKLDKILESNPDIYSLDLEYYKEIALNSKIFFDYFATKAKTKAFYVTPSLCTHHHKYAPVVPYLGMRYEIYDKGDNLFYKIKFSPYCFKQYNRVEFNLGIVFTDPVDILTIKKYDYFSKHFTLTTHTNFSASHLYIHCIINKFIKTGLDPAHIGYEEDINNLYNYAKIINQKIPEVGLSFNEQGIASYNKHYKIKSLIEQTKNTIFNKTSSYYIKH